MALDTVHVLITGAGTATTQSIIKGLRRQKEIPVVIHTADMSDFNAGRYMSDHFHVIPAAKDPSFLERLLGICRQHAIHLIIPIVDYEFDLFSKHRDTFKEVGTTVVISDPTTILRCNDKWETFKFFQDIGVHTPMTWLASDFDVASAQWPVFIKPGIMGRGSIDAYRVDNAKQLDIYLKDIPSAIIQEHIVGKEYTVDILCGFDGRPINGLVRERIETKAGLSYKGITLEKPEILATAKRIAEELGAIGHLNLQCFDSDKGPCFFEVNPRYSGTLTLSIAAEFNSPHLLLKDYLGHPIDIPFGTYKRNVTMLRYWQEIFVDEDGSVLPSHPVREEP